MDKKIWRFGEKTLSEMLEDFSAIMLIGPRASGKTTLAKSIGESLVQFDKQSEADIFTADPDDALLRYSKPLIIDEWQIVPNVLGAIKRYVDNDHSRGQFVLTGSVKNPILQDFWPATGRVVNLQIWPLSQAEILGNANNGHKFFLSKLYNGEIPGLDEITKHYSIGDYYEILLKGGFPEPAIQIKSERSRVRWYLSYIDQLITKDIPEIADVKNTANLEKYLRAVCSNTSGTPQEKTLYEAAGIDRKTAKKYDDLFSRLFVVDDLLAWKSNHMQRLIGVPKKHIVDPALACAMLGYDMDRLVRDGNFAGNVLESFVVSQIRSEIPNLDQDAKMYHLRTKDGDHEIDLLIEFSTGDLIAIEIKATASPKLEDAKHLKWFKDKLGDRVIASIVLNTGPASFELADGIYAVPISKIWE